MNIPRTALAAIVSMACMTAAQANIVNFSGNTGDGETFNRLVEQLDKLSAIGTAVGYDSYSFSVETTGTYTFLTTSDFDSFTFLYQGGFDASAPLSNILAGDDDLFGETTSGLFGELSAGTTYVLVITGFANHNFGLFNSTIGGPGNIVPTPAVPEPETAAMFALGLGVLEWARRRQAKAA